ncbi:PREDICTED: CLAVATA3/ESR (CLE)-related protein 16 [Tarenaya hassleriana]|uniref:CLAVATA3/ESR (CLE)-related protein 16 n=1 Tax=Tarenaya hassleriana TaxID=28532 RepID=UPI00053C872F|nr:PREDICTED: CLAVATA3/ESR (CLE)-related protein 16 [Tarenaya hassleriana]
MEAYVASSSSRRRRAAQLMAWWVILILAQFTLSSAHFHNFDSPPRKVVFFQKTAPSHEAPRALEDQDRVYEGDKRLVHTGPNPLHN